MLEVCEGQSNIAVNDRSRWANSLAAARSAPGIVVGEGTYIK